MSVELPDNALPLTTEDIRMFLRDTPEHNPLLLDGVEFSDPDIQRAIKLTVAKWNAMTPQSSDPPNGETLNEYVLLMGTCSILLRSEGVRQLRNQLMTQDANISPVGLDEKEALYSRWSDRLQAEFDTLARQIKIQNNMESCYGGFSSGYRYIGRYTV